MSPIDPRRLHLIGGNVPTIGGAMVPIEDASPSEVIAVLRQVDPAFAAIVQNKLLEVQTLLSIAGTMLYHMGHQQIPRLPVGDEGGNGGNGNE